VNVKELLVGVMETVVQLLRFLELQLPLQLLLEVTTMNGRVEEIRRGVIDHLLRE